MDDLFDWLALSLTPGLGVRGWQKLLAVFSGPREILTTEAKTIRRLVPGLPARVVEAIDRDRLSAGAEKELERAGRENIKIICFHSESYPDLLRNIHDPPVLLYVKGREELLQSNCLGMVGSRAATVYGRRIAEDLARRLSLKGLTIVSGLALGIDAAAHTGALRGSGATIGVLGCGLDVIYPRQHRSLFEEMAARAAIVSEYRLGTPPEAFRFPARNRIISGLSLGVIVVEAARRSGSLITADHALEQGREVFAIPGRIDSCKSEGAHRLLQQGAKLVHTVDDIIEDLPPYLQPAQGPSPEPGPEKVSGEGLTTEEGELLALIDVYPQTVDEIVTSSGLPVQKVHELLLMLELKGVIESLPGNLYQQRARKK